MSEVTCPVCEGKGRIPYRLKRPLRGSKALAEERHQKIVRLHQSGLYLKEIAFALGLVSHTSVRYHLREQCSCFNGE